jgi:hypothetical protein
MKYVLTRICKTAPIPGDKNKIFYYNRNKVSWYSDIKKATVFKTIIDAEIYKSWFESSTGGRIITVNGKMEIVKSVRFVIWHKE